MARTSDFEKAILGFISALEGGQSAHLNDREFGLRLENQDLARRQSERADKSNRIQEFASLGAPLDQIERGMDLAEAPTFRGMKAGGFDIGQEPTLGERQDFGAFDKFNKRLESKGHSDQPRDYNLDKMVTELGQLRDKASYGDLSPDETRRLKALEAAVDSKTGLKVPAGIPEPAEHDAPREEGFMEKAGKGIRKFRGMFQDEQPSDLGSRAQQELERRRGKKK